MKFDFWEQWWPFLVGFSPQSRFQNNINSVLNYFVLVLWRGSLLCFIKRKEIWSERMGKDGQEKMVTGDEYKTDLQKRGRKETKI